MRRIDGWQVRVCAQGPVDPRGVELSNADAATALQGISDEGAAVMEWIAGQRNWKTGVSCPSAPGPLS